METEISENQFFLFVFFKKMEITMRRKCCGKLSHKHTFGNVNCVTLVLGFTRLRTFIFSSTVRTSNKSSKVEMVFTNQEKTMQPSKERLRAVEFEDGLSFIRRKKTSREGFKSTSSSSLCGIDHTNLLKLKVEFNLSMVI